MNKNLILFINICLAEPVENHPQEDSQVQCI